MTVISRLQRYNHGKENCGIFKEGNHNSQLSMWICQDRIDLPLNSVLAVSPVLSNIWSQINDEIVPRFASFKLLNFSFLLLLECYFKSAKVKRELQQFHNRRKTKLVSRILWFIFLSSLLLLWSVMITFSWFRWFTLTWEEERKKKERIPLPISLGLHFRKDL